MRGVTIRWPTLGRMALVLAVVLWAGACDDDPSGPGTFDARVLSPADEPAGAAVIEITGEGIEGFEASGSSRIFARTVRAPTEENGEGLYRVVVVAPAGSALRFRVRVEDVAAGPPTATLVSVADTANHPVGSPGDHRIRFGL